VIQSSQVINWKEIQWNKENIVTSFKTHPSLKNLLFMQSDLYLDMFDIRFLKYPVLRWDNMNWNYGLRSSGYDSTELFIKKSTERGKN
jgi:hypothetical protein